MLHFKKFLINNYIVQSRCCKMYLSTLVHLISKVYCAELYKNDRKIYTIFKQTTLHEKYPEESKMTDQLK